MKRSLVILLVSLVSLNLSAQDDSIEKLIASKDFSIKIDYVFASKYSRTLTDVRTFAIKNDSVITNLPYFGRAYNATMNDEGGIIFNDPINNYTVETKRNRYLIHFDVRRRGESYEVLLDVDKSGAASLSISSSRRSSIRYNGEIIEKK